MDRSGISLALFLFTGGGCVEDPESFNDFRNGTDGSSSSGGSSSESSSSGDSSSSGFYDVGSSECDDDDPPLTWMWPRSASNPTEESPAVPSHENLGGQTVTANLGFSTIDTTSQRFGGPHPTDQCGIELIIVYDDDTNEVYRWPEDEDESECPQRVDYHVPVSATFPDELPLPGTIARHDARYRTVAYDCAGNCAYSEWAYIAYVGRDPNDQERYIWSTGFNTISMDQECS